VTRTVIKPFSLAASPARRAGTAGGRQFGDGLFGRLGDWRIGDVLHRREETVVAEAFPASADGPARYLVKRLEGLAPSTRAVEQLRREVAAAGDVAHPNVVAVLQAHVDASPYYFIMPRLEGETLAARIAGGPVPTATALWIARQAAAGLQALHGAGRRHGDVKPANVLVDPRGHVTLVDLGFARRMDEEHEPTSDDVAGTADYLAPEMVTSRLRVDGRADLYALGVVMFEQLAGRLPFAATTTPEMVAAHVSQEPPLLREVNPRVPNEVAALVRRLLYKDPRRRPETAAEVVDELARLEIAFFDER
jgi:eukaryotic-like serine/threonine-protein kinase